ncbi:membrane lipoprotein lipid attachment site-containing protein [Jiella sp. M17.18]|uniref:membrane lipoprotein lipid attachment site-containing protein n=1 Tax=Jiella sp. M17.18 TaxID=3234247 RepID=UPI0034DF7C59
MQKPILITVLVLILSGCRTSNPVPLRESHGPFGFRGMSNTPSNGLVPGQIPH